MSGRSNEETRRARAVSVVIRLIFIAIVKSVAGVEVVSIIGAIVRRQLLVEELTCGTAGMVHQPCRL